MTDTSISPLRQRMIEDMTVRGFTAGTQRSYITAVRGFTAFFGRFPDQATAEDLRRYQLHMRSSGATATSMNAAVSALRFLFGVTLGRNDAETGMTTVRHEFIRRFLIHVLPSRFHRIRHYGLFANGNRVANIARARELLDVPALQDDTKAHTQDNEPAGYVKPCPCCGGELIIIETFERRTQPRAPPQQGVGP